MKRISLVLSIILMQFTAPHANATRDGQPPLVVSQCEFRGSAAEKYDVPHYSYFNGTLKLNERPNRVFAARTSLSPANSDFIVKAVIAGETVHFTFVVANGEKIKYVSRYRGSLAGMQAKKRFHVYYHMDDRTEVKREEVLSELHIACLVEPRPEKSFWSDWFE